MRSHPSQSPEFVEHIADLPIDCGSILSDDALSAGGLVRVNAFMRTKSSANAARVKKSRAKATENGVGQLNVVVPLAAHAALKAIAKDLQDGAELWEVLKAALAVEAQVLKPIGPPDSARHSEQQALPLPHSRAQALELAVARLARLWGWRRLLARLFGLL